jgi:hypothetical protein
MKNETVYNLHFNYLKCTRIKKNTFNIGLSYSMFILKIFGLLTIKVQEPEPHKNDNHVRSGHVLQAWCAEMNG